MEEIWENMAVPVLAVICPLRHCRVWSLREIKGKRSILETVPARDTNIQGQVLRGALPARVLAAAVAPMFTAEPSCPSPFSRHLELSASVSPASTLNPSRILSLYLLSNSRKSRHIHLPVLIAYVLGTARPISSLPWEMGELC